MGIEFKPPEFPEHRLNDPKRRAEADVFHALQNLGLNGHGIYEFRYRAGGRQLDKAVWGNHVGRFALQVKGGLYDMDEAGQWYRIRPDGTRERVSCPLEETEDGCMEMHNAIKEATGYSNFVVGVTLFPDMERNARMEEVARRRNHVYIIWGLANLREDLERIACEAPVRHPPKPSHSENECCKVSELQYRGPEDQREDVREMPDGASGQANSLEAERQLTLDSATIHIHQVNTLVIQHGPPERDIEGQTYMCGL